MVSFEGVAVNQDNITKVKKWPISQSVKDVEKFLRFVKYHHDHIHGYTSLTSILNKLIGSNAIFDWQKDHQQALDSVKEKLGIGAVLSQLQYGDEKVISYGSYVLTTEQRKYCVTRREF